MNFPKKKTQRHLDSRPRMSEHFVDIYHLVPVRGRYSTLRRQGLCAIPIASPLVTVNRRCTIHNAPVADRPAARKAGIPTCQVAKYHLWTKGGCVFLKCSVCPR